MPDQELVAAYLQGKINSWTFVRRLLKAGVTLGTAITFTALLPSAAQSGELAQLEQLTASVAASNPDEAAVLERLLSQLAMSIVPIQNGGSHMPLRNTLARLAANVANTGNSLEGTVAGNTGNLPFDFTNVIAPNPGNVNVIDPNLANIISQQNIDLNISGNIGDVPLLLDGFVNVNVNGQRGIRGSFVNVSGNVGDIQIAFNVPREQE